MFLLPRQPLWQLLPFLSRRTHRPPPLLEVWDVRFCMSNCCRITVACIRNKEQLLDMVIHRQGYELAGRWDACAVVDAGMRMA